MIKTSDTIVTANYKSSIDSKGQKIKLKGFDKAFMHKVQLSQQEIKETSQAQKISKEIACPVQMDLAEDILDIGTVAFNLLSDVRDAQDQIYVQCMAREDFRR